MKPTVLLADDDRALLELLDKRCRAEGWSTMTVEDGLTAISSIDLCVPDVVCLDINMPSGTGFSVCDMMLRDERLKNIPIIILTGSTDPQTMSQCRKLGARHISKGANVWKQLRREIQKILDQRDTPDLQLAEATSLEEPATTETQSPKEDSSRKGWAQAFLSLFRRQDGQLTNANERVARVTMKPVPTARPNHPEFATDTTRKRTPCVLHIEDDADLSAALKMRLESHGVAVIRAFEGTDGYRTALRYPIDVILLDFELPDGRGDYVLRRLKESETTKDIPVVVLTGRTEKSLERTLLGLGATRVLTKPARFEELRQELSLHLDLLSRPTDLDDIHTVMASNSHPLPSAKSRERRERVGV